MVELTSPTTTTPRGSTSCARSHSSKAARIFAVWAPCVPLPTLRWTSGAGISSSRKKTSDIAAS